MRRLAGLPVLALALLLQACGGEDKPEEPLPRAERELTLESPAFRDGGSIPVRFSCDGDDVSPPLAWSGVPAGAGELTLLVEDPDADRFVHWTVLGISPELRRLAEGRVPPGAIETENGFGDRRWGGPCPPEGDQPHRYVFALYATKAPLRLGEDASPDEVREALGDRPLARGTLTGRLGR
jgi:Raf kinase inhibitor-like YbhB/YbcL family protein